MVDIFFFERLISYQASSIVYVCRIDQETNAKFRINDSYERDLLLAFYDSLEYASTCVALASNSICLLDINHLSLVGRKELFGTPVIVVS